jgi:hypothetical protein
MELKTIKVDHETWKTLRRLSVEQEKSIGNLIKEKFKEDKKMIVTGEVIDKLTNCPEGEGWKVLVWKDGSMATIIGSGYGGEQDGNNPILILNRDDYGELTPDMDDADLYDQIERQVEESGGNWTRERL